jgi:hypothetical protein
MLFFCDVYYPSGGMEDFVKAFDSEAEAKTFLSGMGEREKGTRGHIYDLEKQEIVYKESFGW